MSKGNATETDLLNKIFKATALPWDAQTDLAVHLHTGDPGEGGTTETNEATYSNYAKVTVVRSAVGWTVSGNTASNAGIIAFNQCGAVGNTITHVSISPDTTTQILYYGQLNSPLAVANLIQPQFQIGQLSKNMTAYVCSQCGLSVVVITDEELKTEMIKACICDAPIIADMSATAYSVSTMGEKTGE